MIGAREFRSSLTNIADRHGNTDKPQKHRETQRKIWEGRVQDKLVIFVHKRSIQETLKKKNPELEFAFN